MQHLSCFLALVRKLNISSSSFTGQTYGNANAVVMDVDIKRPFLCKGHIIDLIFVETSRQIIRSFICLKKRNPRTQPTNLTSPLAESFLPCCNFEII